MNRLKAVLRRLRLAFDYHRGSIYHEIQRMRSSLHQELRNTSMSTYYYKSFDIDGNPFPIKAYIVTYMGQPVSTHYSLDGCYAALNNLRREIVRLGVIRIQSELKIA